MAVKNSLQAKASKPTFSNFLTSEVMKNKLDSMMGAKEGLRFTSAIISAVSVNPALRDCDFNTIVSGALIAHSLGLMHSPQLAHYYLVPFNNKFKDTKDAIFQMGYRGFLQLAIRSGQYKKINVIAIKEGELISYNPLEEELNVNLIEDEETRENAKTIGYYTMFELINGFKKTMYWSKEKMLKHADRYSPAFNAKKYADIESGKIQSSFSESSFWYKDFDGMAFKTMLRQLISKWGVMSVELETAFTKDETVNYDEKTSVYANEIVEEENNLVVNNDTGEVVEPIVEEKSEPKTDNKLKVGNKKQQVSKELEEHILERDGMFAFND